MTAPLSDWSTVITLAFHKGISRVAERSSVSAALVSSNEEDTKCVVKEERSATEKHWIFELKKSIGRRTTADSAIP